MQFYPLFTLNRGAIPEIVVHGFTIAWDGKKLLFGRKQDLNSTMILRSLAKPWQFMNLDIDDDHDFMTLGFASHSGQVIHQNKLAEFQKHFEISEDDLSCPAVWPMDAKAKMTAKAKNDDPQKMFHPCSGKHMAHLAKCKLEGLDLKSYRDPLHPLQVQLTTQLRAIAGKRLNLLTDSCGLPTFSLAVQDFLQMCQMLVTDKSTAAQRLMILWRTHPRLMGGINRLDSDISEDLGDYFIAKEAADGLFMVQSIIPEQPLTVVIKIAGGYNIYHTAMALYAALSQFENPSHVADQLKQYLAMKMRDIVPDDQTFHVCAPPKE